MLAGLGVPLICAGGIGSEDDFVEALRLGYAGVQMGTRFIASAECSVHPDYKAAIVAAEETDVVLTERITGVPVAVLDTPYIRRMGTRAGPLSRFLLRNPRTKHLMRTVYALRSLRKLKHASKAARGSDDYWQAGTSVAGITGFEPAGEIVRRFAAAAERALGRGATARQPLCCRSTSRVCARSTSAAAASPAMPH